MYIVDLVLLAQNIGLNKNGDLHESLGEGSYFYVVCMWRGMGAAEESTVFVYKPGGII